MLRVCVAAATSLLVFLGTMRVATAAPRITKGPWVQWVGPNSAIVRVEVSPAAPVSLTLDGTPRAFDDSASVTLHEIKLDNLTPASRYPYSIHDGAVTKQASFTTAPLDDSTAPFKFLVFGDNRTDDGAHASVVRQMVPSSGDFLIHTGDFVENGASPAQWQTFFDIEAPLLASRPLVAAVGNHELVDGSGIEFVKYFGPGGTTKPEHLDHTFRWGNTRFFLMNGMSSFKSGVERDWLDKVLTDADNEKGLVWRIVVIHHGPWSSGPHGNNPRLHEAGLPGLFTQHRIDVVLSGHDHVYERGIGEGLPFVVTGGGGAPLYRLRKRIPESRRSESVHHFVEVEATPHLLTFNAVLPSGSRIERCALSKEQPGWFCGDLPTSVPVDGGAPALGDPEKAAPPPPPSRCACSEVGLPANSAPFSHPELACAALPLVAYLRRRRRY